MSVPINHHYVSQCHLREFYNAEQKKIYLYDKERKNFYNKTSTKHLFSENYLNSLETKGQIDHLKLETELKILLEDDFPGDIKIIKEFILNPYENRENAELSLYSMALLGALGELRHPKFKKGLDGVIDKFEDNIFKALKTYSSTRFKKSQLFKEKLTPYNNVIGYADSAFRVLERMGELKFTIFVLKSNDHFLLPDTSCFQVRGQLRRYANPFINEITYIGIPITNKIYVACMPRDYNNDQLSIITVTKDNSQGVLKINSDLYGFAYQAVACHDEDFLKQTIASIQRLN